MSDLKVAVVHDWLVTYTGAERVLEQILQLCPDASIYSLFDFLPDKDRQCLLGKTVTTSFIQQFPFVKRHYRNYLLFFPLAVERFDLSGYDLIISSSFSVAKGARKKPGQVHICYCHTPVRYAWDLEKQYLKESGLDKGMSGFLAKSVLGYIRRWDLSTADRVDHYIANSRYVAQRIKRIYGRESVVIYPPVYVDKFNAVAEKENFYVTVSRLVPYKKTALIVEAFNMMPDRKLVVIGDGPELSRVKSAAGKNVDVLGYQPFEITREYLQKARAFIFAADEDFGIAPVEAQACGTPVIAYGKGGVLETVVEGETGIFFQEQTASNLMEAVMKFEKISEIFDSGRIRKHALQFGTERFRKEFREFVDRAVRS